MGLTLVATVLGGVGLFLLGMRLMTDGLKVAAGEQLRRILTGSTRTRVRGLLSGALMTSLVQSSSAITVATIGFVNAGLLTLGQAISVTFGSNIGTTMTGWLVAAVGFHFNVRALALPLVGMGMAMRLFGRGGRVGPLGEALAGFGIFFLGIDVLRGAFDGMGDQIQIAALVGAGPLRVLLFVAIGFILTVLMQSSSAAIAIILTAAGGGVVPLSSGAALVIGANVGTTSTAGLAVIGATSNAKRVAAGHVAFNFVTGLIALLLLPLLLLLIAKGRAALDLDAEPAAILAAFHTLFNVLGVLVMWPLTNRLIRFLEGRFRTAEEDESRPRYLDQNVLATPRLALDALVLEVVRIGQIVRRAGRAALDPDRGAPERVAAARRSVDALIVALGDFVEKLVRERAPAELDELVPGVLRASRYYSEAAELATMVALSRPPGEMPFRDEESAALEAFVESAVLAIDRIGLDIEGYEVSAEVEQLAGFEESYQTLKANLLVAASHGDANVHQLVSVLDWLSNVRRMVEQVERGARTLAGLPTPVVDQ